MTTVEEMDTWAFDCPSCGANGFVCTEPHSQRKSPESCPFCMETLVGLEFMEATRRLLLRVDGGQR